MPAYDHQAKTAFCTYIPKASASPTGTRSCSLPHRSANRTKDIHQAKYRTRFAKSATRNLGQFPSSTIRFLAKSPGNKEGKVKGFSSRRSFSYILELPQSNRPWTRPSPAGSSSPPFGSQHIVTLLTSLNIELKLLSHTPGLVTLECSCGHRHNPSPLHHLC
jgi:hypothetical protein